VNELPEICTLTVFKQQFKKENITVSYRGNRNMIPYHTKRKFSGDKLAEIAFGGINFGKFKLIL